MTGLDYVEVGESQSFKVSTAQCKYRLVVDYINSTYDSVILNVCGGDKTTPIKHAYNGTGGDYDVIGRFIGDNPACQPIPSWVSGIITTVRPCD